ncbi:DUF397 domain-containing protein [Spirillospora sp. NPDC048911]|uniref:DUF397 domain-containing protein n=1 Tax=Spirillospora sp. NPDC048911 TaxID=3364527 RepID=UPI003715AFCC
MGAEQASQSPWIKSRHCGASNTCVEVRRLPGRKVGVRAEAGPGEAAILILTEAGWLGFTNTVKSGVLDPGIPPSV